MKAILWLVLMTIEVFAGPEDWSKYNSSLLIEVKRPTGVFTCSGVAVSPELVLTAAHCLEGEIDGIRVFTQANYDPKQESLETVKYRLHPDYDSGKSRYRHDLAKIFLKEKLPSYIRFYPVVTSESIYGTILRFGFGARNGVNVRTVVTPGFRRVNLEEEVLELDDKFSRSGDSGGPIFLKNGREISLLAIHSTFSFGPEGEYSMNPLLSHYQSWIFEH